MLAPVRDVLRRVGKLHHRPLDPPVAKRRHLDLTTEHPVVICQQLPNLARLDEPLDRHEPVPPKRRCLRF